MPQVPRNQAEDGQNHDALKAVSATLLSLKVKWGYVSAQKLERKRLKSFPVSISLQTQAIRS